MVQIVLSLSEEKEKELRQLAMEKYGGRKGALSKVVEDAITLVKENFDQKDADKEFEEMIKNAKNLGKIKFDRQEANYRKIFP